MPSRRERVLDQHLLQLESAEARAARQIAAAYNQARQEIIANLLTLWNPTGIDTPDQALQRLRQLALLDQVDARLQQLERESGIILRGVINAQAEQGVDQVRRELALLPPSLRPRDVLMFSSVNDRMVERFAPAALDGLRVSTTDLGLSLRRELQSGLIQGEAFPSLVTRLLRTTPEGEGTALFPRARTSAELATRRAVITAENAAKVEAIGEVASAVPEVQKQAIAAIGQNTTDCCLQVHGQIQPNSAPFQLTGEPRFADAMMAPAFHWNCRTSVAMYHPLFEATMPTAKLREAAKAEQDRRKAARAKKRDESAAGRRTRQTRQAADAGRLAVVETRQTAAIAPPEPTAAETRARFQQIEQETRAAIAAERTADKAFDKEFKKLYKEQDAILKRFGKAKNPEEEGIINEEYARFLTRLDALQTQRDRHTIAIQRLEAQLIEDQHRAVWVRDPARNTLEVPAGASERDRRDWQLGMERFNRLVSRRVWDGNAVKVELLPAGDRAHYLYDRLSVALAPGDLPRVVVHEVGHALEHRGGQIDKVMAFFDQRTAGENWEKLSALTGNPGYDDSEVAKKDKWLHPYMGKDYQRQFTEIVSMGVELMADDPADFAKKDPDMFDFIFNLLRGR